ncbi:MAG: TrkH family potassium uptake protein [Marinobacter sp.]|uniref:TrkH family potassium uptake protein n=1 Tax=Marinobacter sp. TaxID=50741 RepID=UPI00299DBFD1|nr:TrkH family potassium uptake protein [Marinobacter sp.]MDX1634108.1 TrkH family potassium uptake protein [Marinobacter sp.]
MLVLLSIFMSLPVLMVFFTEAPNAVAFINSAIFSLTLGVLGLILTRGHSRYLKPRSMFILTVGSWLLVSLFSALPFYFSNLNLSLTDALFESISGITTTGSTVLTGLDQTSPDILLWRSVLQWIGGIGIIGMFVAVLPFLGIGGMRLFTTESSEWTDKALPRMKTLGRGLMLVYITFSLVAVLTYWASGMTFFDALNHGLTSIATGGFSTSDQSMGKFDSNLILIEASVFMVLGALPFFLYVRELNGQHGVLWRDQQVRAFLLLVLVVASAMTLFRWFNEHGDPFSTFAHTLFNITSIITTTGYASQDYQLWGPFAFAAFFFLMFVGGCSGSTSGGMKIFRFQLSMMVLREQFKRLLHPRAVLTRNFNGRAVSDEIIASMIAYAFIFLVCLLVGTLALSLLGLDFITSLSGALTSLTNVGPGLGTIIGPAGTFQSLPDAAKWVLCLGMIAGRLELLSVLVVVSPGFWKG